MTNAKNLINDFVSEISEYLEKLEIKDKEFEILGNNWKEFFLSLKEKYELFPRESYENAVRASEEVINKKIKYINLIDKYFESNKRSWKNLPFSTKKERLIVKEKAIEELKNSHWINFYDYPQYDSDGCYDDKYSFKNVEIKKINKWNNYLGKATKTMTISQLEEFVNEEKKEMIEWFDITCLDTIVTELKSLQKLEMIMNGDKNCYYISDSD